MAKKKVDKTEFEAVLPVLPENPITMTFRPVINTVTGDIMFLDTYLMLDDAEMGLMAPGMYFFAAENSKRAEELNFIAIDLIANAMDKAKVDWDLEPVFSLLCTTRFLEEEDKFVALLAKLDSMELPKYRIILTFSALTVLHLGREANKYLRQLREAGYKVGLTDYTVDTADLSLFFDYSFDYLRVDADYLEDSFKYTRKKSAAEVMVAFAEKEGIVLVANGVADKHLKSVMGELGLTNQSGKAVARGSYKLDLIYGIAPKEDTVGLDLEASYTSEAVEQLEEEAPKARKNSKKKNKTAVLEKEVADLDKKEAQSSEKPAKKGKKAKAEEPIEEVTEEVAEPTAEAVEEVTEEVTEPTAEAVEEVTEEVAEPTAEAVEEVTEEVAEPTTKSVEEVTEEVAESQPTEGYADENVELSVFVSSLGIEGLTEEDYLLIKQGGLDALTQQKREAVLTTLEQLS